MSLIDVPSLAVVVVRDGRLPVGADESVAEAAGAVVVVGTGAEAAAGELPSAHRVWWAEAPAGAVALASALAPVLARTRLVVLAESPDGRDLAPHLAARMGRPLLAGAVRAGLDRPEGPKGLGEGRVTAELLRADGRVIVPVSAPGAAVVTLWPGARSSLTQAGAPEIEPLSLGDSGGAGAGAGAGEDGSGEAAAGAVTTVELVEPDPATMDLADARRVLAGGAGLVPEGAGDDRARALFELLTEVAAALGASAGATRVVTDAGWMGYDRQIGTTGITLRPELYVALGVSGASQHTGGIGDPERTVSVNLDASCPMTGLADLGLVADAPALLVELARRLGVPVPPEAQLSPETQLPPEIEEVPAP